MLQSGPMEESRALRAELEQIARRFALGTRPAPAARAHPASAPPPGQRAASRKQPMRHPWDARPIRGAPAIASQPSRNFYQAG